MQGIFQKENTDKALKYGIYRHLPTYEKIIRNLVSFYQETSEIFPYQINFDARIQMQKIADSKSIDYAYTGNPRELSLEKGKKSPGAVRKHRHP